ncbi:uncharacterized protein (DUF1330 family)/uncharacterized protein YjiS (DUF1127 family) [Nitrobacteraceae bacterium AZCC 2146]
MSDDGFDPRSYDVRYLTPLQWTARKRSIIERAHAERRRTIRLMFACAIGAVRSACRRMRHRQEARDALRSMTDYELKDIGLARSGIEAAIRRGEQDANSATLSEPRQLWRAMMSKAYWIVRVSVRDEEHYPEYLAAARPAFEKFGARFIVRGGAFETMEGSARDRNVVVEFADRATATACYRSAEYDAAKAIRQKYAEADFIIIDGP